ncbi:hypothetical protein B5M45_00330 [Mycobacterium simiae]|uniref:Uncharacterized protein n=1 Tax=Mycobacterium simiae TaxID=1784 RepID=A0A1X0YHD6_MYCSI|nr:hypothetical protein B5M45_00330 [Mycobacterium simiae]
MSSAGISGLAIAASYKPGPRQSGRLTAVAADAVDQESIWTANSSSTSSREIPVGSLPARPT